MKLSECAYQIDSYQGSHAVLDPDLEPIETYDSKRTATQRAWMYNNTSEGEPIEWLDQRIIYTEWRVRTATATQITFYNLRNGSQVTLRPGPEGQDGYMHLAVEFLDTQPTSDAWVHILNQPRTRSKY